jgi:hypothetical protein
VCHDKSVTRRSIPYSRNVNPPAKDGLPDESPREEGSTLRNRRQEDLQEVIRPRWLSTRKVQVHPMSTRKVALMVREGNGMGRGTKHRLYLPRTEALQGKG